MTDGTFRIDFVPNNGRKRSVSLPEGTYILGSDLECDIVILDCPVPPRCIELSVGNGKAILNILDGGPAEVTPPDGAPFQIATGDNGEFEAHAHISLAPFKMAIFPPGAAGDQPVDGGEPGNQHDGSVAPTAFAYFATKNGFAQRCIKMTASAATVVAVGVAIAMVPSPVWSGLGSALRPQRIDPNSGYMTPRANSSVPQNTEIAGNSNSPNPVNGNETPSKIHPVENVQARVSAPEIVHNDQMVRGPKNPDVNMTNDINLVLANFGDEVSLSSIEGTTVTVRTKTALKHKESTIENTLKSDFPGVNTVQFQYESNLSADEFIESIRGLWEGQAPYIIMSDGAVHHVGGMIGNKIELVSINNGIILLKENGILKNLNYERVKNGLSQ